MPRYAIPRRGEVWRVDLGFTIGHEVQKTRPCVIATGDAYNENNWVVLVVPLTSRDQAQLDQVLIQPPEGGLTKSSVALPDQLRAIDRSRLVQRLGKLRSVTMREIDQCLKIVMDLR